MTGRALFQPTSLSATTLAVTLMLSVLGPSSAVAAPEGQLTWAVHVSLAPTWFDPAETVGIVTPFMFLYALHDALVKPMPATRWRRAWPSRGASRPTGSPTSSSCARACGFTTVTR